MGSKIAKIDCPARPHELKAGDIVICSSDGLQFMTNAQIEKVLAKYRKTRSTEIAERLLEELARLGDPDQDNISFTVIKVNDASVRPKQNRPPRQSLAPARPRGLTTVAQRLLVSDPKPKTSPAPDHEAAAAGKATLPNRTQKTVLRWKRRSPPSRSRARPWCPGASRPGLGRTGRGSPQ